MKKFDLLKYGKYIPLLLVTVNFIVKGWFLASTSIGGDEPFSIYFSQLGVPDIITFLSKGNNPPLYEIILHFWIKFFGISEWAVRFPSLLFSCLTVYFIYKLGIAHLNRRIAVWSSLVFIFSNYQIQFSHEARVYSLLGLLSILSVYYYLNIIAQFRQSGEISLNSKQLFGKLLIKYLVVNILLIYSHYFGFFILIVQLLFLIFNKELFLGLRKQIVWVFGVLLVMYLPNILVFVHRFYESSVHGTWVEAPSGLISIYFMLKNFSNEPVVAVFIILIMVYSIISRFISHNAEKYSINQRFIVFWFVFVFLLMFVVSFKIPMFIDRYVMPAAIAYSLLVGILADRVIAAPVFKYIVPVIVCILFTVTVKPNITNKRNVRETVCKIKEIATPKTLTIICPYDFILNFSYYYNLQIFQKADLSGNYQQINRQLKVDNIYGVNSINDVAFHNHDKVVYLDAASEFTCPGNSILDSLKKSYVLVNQYKFYKIFNVYEFKRE
jgi:mannosyltransferase